MTIQKLAKGFRRFLPLWTISALVLGFGFGILLPQLTFILKKLILSSSFALIYLMCIPLRIEDLVKTVKYPKILLLGLVFSLFLAPLFMFPAAKIFVSSHPQVFAGLILAGVVPPGGMNTFWTGIMGADVSLAMIMQILTFTVAIFWIPLGMQIFAGSLVKINYMFMFVKLILIVVIPLVLALITRQIITRTQGEKGVLKGIPYFQFLSGLLALLLVFIATGLKSHAILKHPGIIYLPAIAAAIYYIFTFLIMGLITFKIIRIKYSQAIPLIFGTGTKNLSIAMALAVTTFGPQALLGVVACSLFQMPLASVFYKIFWKLKPTAEAPELQI